MNKKALCLLSSGIDSPVAAYVMLSQGLHVDCIHFDNFNSKNRNSLETVKKLISQLEKKTKRKIKLFVVNYKNIQEAFDKCCNKRYQCLLCKRMMYRIAEKIALKNKYDFLLTGENLGQVASQTLENIYVLDRAVETAVLRPLLTYDKLDIIKKAQSIGTYDISISDKTKCPFVPEHPKTRSELDKVEYQESMVDIDNLVYGAVSEVIN
ncbi:7-cyano-7-deazaguanine synthase [Candidatus Woesearchaeota archaeon]|nr:7-cyano-7-deazaguanine synthase [Candidatus Woesearchaeota archaeon]